MIVLDCLLVAFIVFLVVGLIYKWIERKRLIKDMDKGIEKYYIKDSYELYDNGVKYHLDYFLLKAKWYEKIKQTDSTSIGFDIDTAYIEYAKVSLMNENKTVVSYLTIPCYKLRKELKQKDLELLEQIKESNVSNENYAILKTDLNKKLKEKELLKGY